MKNLEATEAEFFAKGYENCNILSEFLETKINNLDDYACPKIQFCYSKMKNMIGGVATTHFVMQNFFTVLKERHLPTEHGLDDFLTNS